ncbi:MAG: stage III sporulation protein AE [Negativicutes bacterium]|nr:stage III sporulation protein AE [Negativicutes bacterium]
MKTTLIVLIISLLVAATAWASPVGGDEAAGAILDRLSIDQVNQFIKGINQELKEDIPLLTVDTIRQIATKGLDFEWRSLLPSIGKRVVKEVTVNLSLMGKLLFLAVLCALLQNLQTSFEQSTIAALAYHVCYIFLVVISLTAFYGALILARETVATMVGMMEALLPLFITLLAGVGAVTSAALFTPLMLFVVSTVSLIVKDLILPLLFLTAVLECVNYLSHNYRLSNLAGVFKQAGMVTLGLTLVLFIGIISIQGAAGSVADGLTLRAAKYATATFIPVVGKMFADTVELVMGASLMIKNAVGIFGIIAIASICAYPIIKLIALIAIIKITGALIQPMGDEKMAKCLEAIGNNLLLVFGGVLTAALMFFLAITIMIGAGSVAMMLR